MLDLNHGSHAVYGTSSPLPVGDRINALIDAALIDRNRRQAPRDYLGGSRIGEPCARKLVYEYAHADVDIGKGFDGRTLRIFDAGHQFETLSICWLRAAGFDLRTHRRDGKQFGFSTANGRIRGHIDGVSVDGPDVGVAWPALWEHKALNAKSWSDTVRRGVRLSKPIYFAQLQLYMAYMELEAALFTVLNKDSQELHHEVVALDVAAALRQGPHPGQQCRCRGRRAIRHVDRPRLELGTGGKPDGGDRRPVQVSRLIADGLSELCQGRYGRVAAIGGIRGPELRHRLSRRVRAAAAVIFGRGFIHASAVDRRAAPGNRTPLPPPSPCPGRRSSTARRCAGRGPRRPNRD